MSDHLDDLAAFCAEWLKQNKGYELIDHGFGPDHGGELTTTKLRAAVAELKRLREQRTSLDGQVFISGWYAHAEACASLGWDAREAAWRKYREEMTATLAKAERDGKVAGQ